MQIFKDTYIGNERMFVRIGTRHCYPRNENTRNAVMQLEWAYEKLDNSNVVFQNGKSSHECANKVIEEQEDILIDNLRVML